MSSPKKPWWRRWFGTRSERAAARYLRKRGCKLLARNFTCFLGELDLVVLDRDCIVFVEVRSTEDRDQTEPAASVDHAKQKRLTRVARFFLRRKRLEERSARFDVVTLRWPAGQKEPEIEHFVNAFDAVD
ncbi:MAG: YraN family protein [Gemmataceae bacterium]